MVKREGTNVLLNVLLSVCLPYLIFDVALKKEGELVSAIYLSPSRASQQLFFCDCENKILILYHPSLEVEIFSI